jgi:hypothetical protein
MARNSAIWSAPSLASLGHDRVRLDCAPEVVRGVWRAQTKAECLGVLVNHFGGAKWGTVAEEQAEDLFHTTALDGQCLRSWGDHKRTLVNRLGGFHGVEYLGVHARSGKVVRYCNAGDAYAPTLCFMGRRLFVACWGDLIERRTVLED